MLRYIRCRQIGTLRLQGHAAIYDEKGNPSVVDIYNPIIKELKETIMQVAVFFIVVVLLRFLSMDCLFVC